MAISFDQNIADAKQAALEVLLHNMEGPYHGLPRTAGWGYPEPYTRDLMISLLGIGVSENQELIASIQRVLETLAENQTEHGHIPSLVHDQDDRGASDTTPLFLLALSVFRKITGKQKFLQKPAQKALTWMAYQSPGDRSLVTQQPTSDWRDEQWVLGHGLYVNTLVYAYLRLYGDDARAAGLAAQLNRPIQLLAHDNPHGAEGLLIPHAPYYALWAYKVWGSTRFDLLGNSLAILTGLAPPERARAMIAWIEAECATLRARGDL